MLLLAERGNPVSPPDHLGQHPVRYAHDDAGEDVGRSERRAVMVRIQV
jgi:hypothetical protein